MNDQQRIDTLAQQLETQQADLRTLQQKAAPYLDSIRALTRQQRETEEQLEEARRRCRNNRIASIVKEAATDFPSLASMMKARILDPDNLPYRDQEGTKHKQLGKADFILYAILRGKPWDAGLSPHTPLLSTRHEREKVQRECAQLLHRVLADHLLASHPHLFTKNEAGFYPLALRHELKKSLHRTYGDFSSVVNQIQDSGKFQ